jgi:hypothetical protein
VTKNKNKFVRHSMTSLHTKPNTNPKFKKKPQEGARPKACFERSLQYRPHLKKKLGQRQKNVGPNAMAQREATKKTLEQSRIIPFRAVQEL